MGATTSFKAYNCPECNAPLTVDENAARVKCTYCGHTFAVRHARPEPPRPQPAPPSPSRTRAWLRWIAMAPVSLFVLAGFLLARRPGLVAVTGGLGGGLQWDAVAPGPILADIDGDGFEDFIGRCRKISPDELWIVGFAGADLRPRWRVGPLGGWEAREAVRFAVSGRRVLVTDGRHTARLVDVGDGATLASVPLSDRAGDVCADPAGGRFFVSTVDGEQFFVSADNATRSDGKRPAWCPRSAGFGLRSPGMRHRFAAGDPLGEAQKERAPRVPGFQTSYVLSDGGRAVAIGEKHPGTPVPMLAGFAPGAHAVDWSRVLPTVDVAGVHEGAVDVAALGRGALYAYYALSSLQGGRVIAVDAGSGVTRWDVILPNGATGSAPEEIVIGRDRVYVPHWTWLDVFDAKSGAVVGTVGRW